MFFTIIVIPQTFIVHNKVFPIPSGLHQLTILGLVHDIINGIIVGVGVPFIQGRTALGACRTETIGRGSFAFASRGHVERNNNNTSLFVLGGASFSMKNDDGGVVVVVVVVREGEEFIWRETGSAVAGSLTGGEKYTLNESESSSRTSIERGAEQKATLVSSFSASASTKALFLI
eukprot:scaffold381_cov178-Amphora_coffeaeformis.AAC.3